MTRLLTEAPPGEPVAWLSLERPMDGNLSGLAEVRLALSPDPQRRLLGRTSYQNSPLDAVR